MVKDKLQTELNPSAAVLFICLLCLFHDCASIHCGIIVEFIL